MKKLLTFLLLAAAAWGQSIPSGSYYVPNYAYGLGGPATGGRIFSGNASTGVASITLYGGQVALPNGHSIVPYATNASIVVGTGATQETVTPTAVSGCYIGAPIGNCTITANFSFVHIQGEFIASGTFGLQEAINDAVANGGGNLVIDRTWGGATSNITNAAGNSSVTITDNRTGTQVYDWNGANYAARGTGGGSGTVTQATAPTSLFQSPILPATGNLPFQFVTNFPANQVIGNCTGSPATPGPCSITALMLPNIPVTNLDSGTNADAVHFWAGSGHWLVPTAGSAAFNTVTSGTNSTAAMVVSTGASLSATGSGSIAATTMPWTGITSLPSSCTNQAVTGLGTTLTCNTITSAYVDTSIAKTGVDINTSNQVTATHLASALPIAQGGTNATTASAAFLNLACSPTRAGDIIYYTGTTWACLAGNNSGTNFLQENSSGVPTWAATAASVAWSGISGAAADTTIPNGNFNTTFTQSAAKNWFWSNTTAATATVNQPSPIFNLCGQVWEGITPANTQDCWNIQNFMGNGANPTISLNFTYGGASTGQHIVQFPGPIATQGAFSTALSGASGGAFALTEGTAPSGGTVGADVVWADQSSHRLKMQNNNGTAAQIVASGVDINTSDQVTALHLTSAPTACTNQALISLSTTLASTCATITSAYVDSTVAVTNASNTYTGGPQDLNTQVMTSEVANDPFTGTTAALLGKMTSTGFIKAGTSDTAIQSYICVSGCTNSGNALYAIAGDTTCTMDSTASNTEGFVVTASTTTAGECHALVPPLAPTSGTWVVGTLKSNSTTLGSAATVHVNPFFVNPASSGSGTTVSVNGSSVSNPNLNGTTPAAGAGNVNVTWQVSSSNVSAEVPNVITANGQTCTLGSTCNVNSGAAAHSVALNQGAGSAMTGLAIGTAGRILTDQGAAADPAFEAMSGDCTFTSAGAITCTKTNGTAFAGLATLTETDGNIVFGSASAWTKGTALPNGITATTQTAQSNDTKVSTDAYVDAHTVNTVADTSSPVTVSTSLGAEYHFNQNATAATAVTYNLPTAAAGKQFCFSNSNNGTAADTGVLTVATSATGQFIVFTDGTLSATGGNVTSGGAAADAACVVGIDSTHWMLYVQRGSWTKH